MEAVLAVFCRSVALETCHDHCTAVALSRAFGVCRCACVFLICRVEYWHCVCARMRLCVHDPAGIVPEESSYMVVCVCACACACACACLCARAIVYV